MSKTAFSKKADLLGLVSFWYKDDDSLEHVWKEFLEDYSLSLSMCHLSLSGLVNIKSDKKIMVEDAWEAFCKMLGLPPQNSYKSLNEMFDKVRERNEINRIKLEDLEMY